MNETKKRLLSCLLLAMGGLNLGTGVSNARSKDVTNMSNVSSEETKRNSKISSIFNLRNGIDILGLLTIIYGGKKLRNNSRDIIKKNSDIIKYYKGQTDDFNLLQDFQQLFRFCLCQSNAGFIHLKDFTEEDCKKYDIVCFNNAQYDKSDEYLSYYFIVESSVDKNEKFNFAFCTNNNFMSVIAPASAGNISEDYSEEYNNLKPFKVAGYSISKEVKREKCAKIVGFKSLFLGIKHPNLYFGGKELLEEHKKKFEDYYIVFEIYREVGEEYYSLDGIYCKVSLVRPKN